MATKIFGGAAGGQPWLIEVNKTADYTVLNTDNGTLFTAGGGATRTFTLPSLVNGVGCTFWFFNPQNNNMVITAPSGKLQIDGNAAATSATYSTGSHLIGAFCMVSMNAAGTFYYFSHIAGPGNVVSIS